MRFYKNLGLRKAIDNKIFWPTVKPLLSDKDSQGNKITLIQDGEIISDDEEVVKTFSSFFIDAVKSLDVSENQYLLTDTDGIDDPVDAAIKKIEAHPSILTIKEKVNIVKTFSFKPINLDDMELVINRLNQMKANTFNDIPAKIIKENCDICSQPLHDILNSVFPDELN